jgi:signal transduction histidine kinase
LVSNVKDVEHTNKIISNLESILSSVKDAEIGIRGYVIARNIDFLEPYLNSQKNADSLFKETGNLFNENPAQIPLLNELKIKIDKKYMVIKNGLASFNKNNLQLTPLLMDTLDISKRLMDSIRADVHNIQEIEKKLLNERTAQLNKSTVAVYSIVLASIIISLFLVFFGFSSHQKENDEKIKAESKVKAYQDELNKTINELRKANEELVLMRSHEKFDATGRIARTFAHEIRNPLTNINLATEQLSSEMTPNDENTGFLFDLIKRNSNRINQLISDLLNSTKFSELNYEKVSINALLDETLQLAQDRIMLNNVDVIKNYSNEICDITVDKEKIKIAFLNIIINALEAMEGKTNAKFTVETKKDEDKCIVIISDTGNGIDDDALSKIFEPYFTKKTKGNGLGLTNTQNIILNHKGNITVKSKEGDGTSFIISLLIV